MSKIKIIRKGNGEAFTNQQKQYVFVKNGINFSLNKVQMQEMKMLIEGLLDGSLISIDPDSETIARGE